VKQGPGLQYFFCLYAHPRRAPCVSLPCPCPSNATYIQASIDSRSWPFTQHASQHVPYSTLLPAVPAPSQVALT
jgi:hypothetical protein